MMFTKAFPENYIKTAELKKTDTNPETMFSKLILHYFGETGVQEASLVSSLSGRRELLFWKCFSRSYLIDFKLFEKVVRIDQNS